MNEFHSLGSTDVMNVTYRPPMIDVSSFQLRPHNYFHEECRKDLIVLHFTAGTSVGGALNHWESDPRRIATAFVVDVDGQIYQTFPPQFWAYALGKGVPTRNDERAIQIEMVNRGPLVRRDDQLCWWPKDFTTPFCLSKEENLYIEKLWRGYGYWTVYTAGQIRAVFQLTRYLCDRFQIPKAVPVDKIQVADVSFFSGWQGICGHQNFRSDKTDPGPAFPWQQLVDFLNRKSE